MSTNFYVFEVPEDQTEILEIMGPHKIADYSDDGAYMMITMSDSEISKYSDFTLIKSFDVYIDFSSWRWDNGWIEPTEI